MKRLFALFLSVITANLLAHCQLPCGIYHDELEFGNLEQCVETLHRANDGILNNTSTSPLGDNQMVRWVLLKDQYADQFVQLLTTYFLQQRIQPGQSNTAALLTLSHEMMQSAMKIKQTVNQDHVALLSCQLSQFKKLYNEQNITQSSSNPPKSTQ